MFKDGSNNVAIGNEAGYGKYTSTTEPFTSGSNNVFIGNKAGYNERGSNKLYISNSDTNTPLIYGDFSSKKLTINGSLTTTGAATVGSLSAGSGSISGGAISGTSLSSSGTATISGTATVGSLSTSGSISGGAITGSSLSTGSGSISGGAITGYSLTTTSSASIGGNISLGGHIIPTASGYADLGSDSRWYDDAFLSYIYVKNSIKPYEDNTVSLGLTGRRWTIVYATSGVSQTSDKRLKTNIKNIEDALSKIKKINGVTYNWRVDEFPEMNFDSDRHAGVLAQEIEEVLPEAVETGEDGYKSVNYSQITPLLIEAIKELKAEKDELKAEKDALEAKVEKLEAQMKEILEKLK